MTHIGSPPQSPQRGKNNLWWVVCFPQGGGVDHLGNRTYWFYEPYKTYMPYLPNDLALR